MNGSRRLIKWVCDLDLDVHGGGPARAWQAPDAFRVGLRDWLVSESILILLVTTGTAQPTTGH